ncbi:Fc.00g069790.m01.CDS01 [Cosmosporella sp. VM-42]
MAASGKGSRWGSFLSQAVAGVESRLDTILADEREEAQQQGGKAQAAKPAQPAQQAAAAKPSPVTSRSSSSNRTNDRLQARLAKAMAAKNAQAAKTAHSPGETKSVASPRSSIDQGSRTSTDRTSIDKEHTDNASEATVKDAPKTAAPMTVVDVAKPATPEPQDSSKKDEVETPEHPTAEELTAEPTPSDAPVSETATNDDAQPEPAIETSETEQPDSEPASAAQRQAEISHITQELGNIKARQEDEIQEYVERIDSLQAKLQYLSKTATDAAKKAAAAAPAGSAERKLAEKDEKIAALLEEGRKLSNSEQKFRTTIRKLRTQLTDNEKQVDELKKDKDKAISESEALRSRMSSEEKEKLQEEARKVNANLQREIDALKKDNAAKDETIRRLGHEIKTNTEQAEISTSDALNKLRATEQGKQKVLEDTIANLRTEKDSLSDKTRLETLEWQEKLDRAVERGRTVETELKHELRTMESKLEAMRTAAEEASSGSGGEAQVKLLRQIETLQSQYASASDNWQGIEASLLAKVANLEKERDEAQRRESEMRKKARDSASRCRQLEGELQDVSPALATAQQELETAREQLSALRISSKSTETALEQARAELEKQRSANRDFAPEAERRQWIDDVAGASAKNQSRPDSPLLSVPRTFSSDLIGLPIPGRPRRVPTPGSVPDSPGESMFFGRRLSSQPPIRPSALSVASPGIPPTPFSPFEAPSESPHGVSPSLQERDDPLDDGDPSSPRNVAQDMISVSTVGAGPSVQLVERMSAAIRRLEAEKVAAKEEMARVCGQRDEARNDILNLMKDVETNKAAASKVAELEQEVAALNSRYQTTLEMLGEKSELVDELKADVQDVKAMYRELVERTVK